MNLNKTTFRILVLIFLFGFSKPIISGGIVYLVLGSDTAIWDGMSTNRYHCYYNIDLYTNPLKNAYQVMDPSFRSQFIDSYGQPLKMTWWMMAGNIFRYADNKNVPVPNIMTLYLMKKYHGENIIATGDELTLHYHTFFWSDYDGDGAFWWNQSKTFNESLDDFNFTLAQFLLEEEVFPVSFRSGWHYMDNDWQHYLDEKILPYSLHNDYPHKRQDETEPLDNTFDWSLSPSDFIPFRPSYSNYQIPGNGKGWNVRSAHFSTTRTNDYMDKIFAAANEGNDQVACLWGHLPENDFLTNIEIMDSLAHEMANRYPDVSFRYCTAIEAMQLWRETNDTQAPNLILSEEPDGNNVYFKIQSDEHIFQSEPFVAVKDIYERYIVAPCIQTSTNEWRTIDPFVKSDLVRAGAAVCDTLGNQSLDFIEYLPADIFIDNLDMGYTEINGNWTTISENAWGTNSRVAQLSQDDSAKVQWTHTINKSTYYNFFIQVPAVENQADSVSFKIYKNQQVVESIKFNSPLHSMDWIYLSTLFLEQSDEVTVELSVSGNNQNGKVVSADVLKISALVRDKDIHTDVDIINIGEVSVMDTVIYDLNISNHGINDLHIFGITSNRKEINTDINFPLTIPAMSRLSIELFFTPSHVGPFQDTLFIMSEDPIEPKYSIPVFADVQNYFITIDNEESSNYEEFGEWYYSVANANGPTSRYAWLNFSPLASASFKTILQKTEVYEIFEIVPSTVNSTDKALYQIIEDNIIVDSIYIDQNDGSGFWVSLGEYFLTANVEVKVKVMDTGESSVGAVLRADAVKFSLIEEVTGIESSTAESIPSKYQLHQNYPNPFNPETVIAYQIPKAEHVKIEVFNLLGERIKTLINLFLPAGNHSITWDGKNYNGSRVASGTYFYRIKAGNFIQTKKMIYLR